MDCALTSSLLLAYHFGTVTEGERTSVDEHLLACPACLRAYFALKHHTDESARALRPSPLVRKRLERAIEREFRPGPAKRALRFLERPIPLYQGALGAAAALALAALLPLLLHLSTPPAQAASGERVDSSRQGPVSLGLY